MMALELKKRSSSSDTRQIAWLNEQLERLEVRLHKDPCCEHLKVIPAVHP